MRIMFLGSPNFAVASLRTLVEKGFDIVAVVTQPDRPAGRKKVLTPPPVKVAAQELGIATILQPETLRDAGIIETFLSLRPDAGVVVAYGQILRQKALNIPPLGYVNIHPSLIPRFRGPTPVASTILAGDEEIGVTIMKLDAGIDSGPILAQKRIPLDPTARAGQLNEELFQLGAAMLPDILKQYAAGTIELQPQDHNKAVMTQLLTKEQGLINWTEPAIMIERKTRAYDPWPGTYTTLQDKTIKIHHVQVHRSPAHQYIPGTIVQADTSLLVATGEDMIEILELQPAGKRSMKAKEWLAGQRNLKHHLFGA